MAENELPSTPAAEESDIFEGFASDEALLQDVDNFDQTQSKDLYDYANITGNGFKIVNIVLVLTLIFTGIYVYIQKNSELSRSQVLNPFCSILLGDVDTSGENCSSIAAASKDFSSELETIKSQQFLAIAEIIQPLYLSTDFINSSEVVFLYDKTKTRLRPLSILEEFDRVKNGFETADKSALECGDIEIKDNIMSAKCDVYSSDWDASIVLPNGEISSTVGGTSISIASSFLDYIENNSNSIRVIEKPKYFSSENVLGENGGYTKRTTFFLQLEYNSIILPL